MPNDLLLSEASNEHIGRELARRLRERFESAESGKVLIQRTDDLLTVAEAAETLFQLSQGVLQMAQSVRHLIGAGDREIADQSMHYARAILAAANFAQVRWALVRQRHVPGGGNATV